jgi:hypothetical protein
MTLFMAIRSISQGEIGSNGNGGFHLFAANGHGKWTFVFFGRQTVNGS